MRFQAAGIRGPAGFDELVAHFRSLGGDAVLLNPEMVVGRRHVLSAAEHAERAFGRGTGRSNSLLTEIVVFAAWDRQIGRALEKMRPVEGSGEYVALVVDVDDLMLDRVGMVRDDSLMDATPEKARALGLDDPFLTPEEQALELVAFTELQKARCGSLVPCFQSASDFIMTTVCRSMNDVAEDFLNSILESPHEDEIVEFKACGSFDRDKMGKYFSALSNEAFLRDVPNAWLIFGIDDSGEVVGTSIFDTVEGRNEIKRYISEQTSNGLSFVDIHTAYRDGKRLVMFQIPRAFDGHPTSFKGFAWERQGDSVIGLTDEKRRRIMASLFPDWSMTPVPGLTVDALDPDAVEMARGFFIKRSPSREEECRGWDDLTFLNKMGLTVDGELTYSALLLFGKPEHAYRLEGGVGMRWILREDDGFLNRCSVFYKTPFILAIDDICRRIHNVDYEILEPGTVSPDRMKTYDEWAIREILNNCVAHQDYRMGEYITVVEFKDRLMFSNAGDFIPGSIDAVLEGDSPKSCYRNKFLAEAMYRFGMVDVAGGGIKRIFQTQAKRLFPMPEYDLSDNHVQVTMEGRVADRGFANILLRAKGLSFEEILLLDKVQKKKSVPADAVKMLRSKGLIGGRCPNYFLTPSLSDDAEDTGSESGASADGDPGNGYYRDLIVAYIEEHGEASKKELVDLLRDRLPDALDERQRLYKVGNLVRGLVTSGVVENRGTRKFPSYHLVDDEV